eukprot:5988851-Pleurochrysis_carterae.AAC.1
MTTVRNLTHARVLVSPFSCCCSCGVAASKMKTLPNGSLREAVRKAKAAQAAAEAAEAEAAGLLAPADAAAPVKVSSGQGAAATELKAGAGPQPAEAGIAPLQSAAAAAVGVSGGDGVKKEVSGASVQIDAPAAVHSGCCGAGGGGAGGGGAGGGGAGGGGAVSAACAPVADKDLRVPASAAEPTSVVVVKEEPGGADKEPVVKLDTEQGAVTEAATEGGGGATEGGAAASVSEKYEAQVKVEHEERALTETGEGVRVKEEVEGGLRPAKRPRAFAGQARGDTDQTESADRAFVAESLGAVKQE